MPWHPPHKIMEVSLNHRNRKKNTPENYQECHPIEFDGPFGSNFASLALPLLFLFVFTLKSGILSFVTAFCCAINFLCDFGNFGPRKT